MIRLRTGTVLAVTAVWLDTWAQMLAASGGHDSSAETVMPAVRGTASDPSVSVVANAAISLTNMDTNAKREVLTGGTGDFGTGVYSWERRGVWRRTI